jgi:hypothetical protein
MSESTGGSVVLDAAGHLSIFQKLMAMPRETLPQQTAVVAREALKKAAGLLGLELAQTKELAPIFLLLPSSGVAAGVTVFATWHAEGAPVHPAAAEGAERLALAAAVGALAGLGAAGSSAGGGAAGAAGGAPSRSARPALVVAPSATTGSLVLEAVLREHRAALQAPAAFWPRIAADRPRRRRIFLGARGKVVLGVWGNEANPYRLRDQLVEELARDAYGPRPLDFELLRKLAQRPEASEFLDEALDDPAAVAGEGEARFRAALFDARGQVHKPPVAHPDRPAAWITIEAGEDMDPAQVLARARALAPQVRVEMAEGFLWDRLNLYQPAVKATIAAAKSRSDGAEIWPMAPWVTPSGVFTRALGVSLAEWAVPLPAGAAIRPATPATLEAIERELVELFGAGAPGEA